MDNNDSTQQEQSQTLTYHSTPTVPAAAHLLQQQHQQLQMFWSYQCEDIKQLTDFKNHPLPLARIKKIMKADEDVRMIAAEAPVLFAKACELFILELTIRSWLHAEENRRRTLQKNDLSAAITRTDIFDFLVDIVPREDGRDESVGFGAGGGGMIGGAGTAAGGVPYYYVQPSMGKPALPPGGMRIGQTGIDLSAVYGQPSQAWQSVWQNAAAGPDDGSYGGESNGQDSQS